MKDLRLSKKISSRPGRDMLKSVVKVRNARVKVAWVEREERSVICIKVNAMSRPTVCATWVESGTKHPQTTTPPYQNAQGSKRS